jgi:hypothetical protein
MQIEQYESQELIVGFPASLAVGESEWTAKASELRRNSTPIPNGNEV